MKQNIHPHLVTSAVAALREIFHDGGYAEKVIEKNLKAHRKWGSRDRRFFAETVYEMVRWWRKCWFLLDEKPSYEPETLLRLWAAYQVMKKQELPAWPELRHFSIPSKRLEEAQSLRVVRESVPDWFDEMGLKEFGGQWDSILSSLNFPSTVDLRVNRLRADTSKVQAELRSEQIETEMISGVVDGLKLKERKNVFITKSYLVGHFEVQDRASQLVAPFLDVSPGMRVVDACAGAGGKSLHIAALMKNKGKLISMDIHEWKLKELRKRATRNGVDIIETKIIDSNKVFKRMEKTADRILLDVPCSGLGVLRRHPDTKWKLRAESFPKILALQESILQDYSQMTKVGGKLVYATCSFLHSENEQQIEKFLAGNPGWALEESLRINPDEGRGDGFFAARLVRQS
jgi:16S rRNA (cytosine967-C5)-methyltransferase